MSASLCFFSRPNRWTFYVLLWRKSSLYIRMRTTLLTGRHPSTTKRTSERETEAQAACAFRWIISVGDKGKKKRLTWFSRLLRFFVWQIFSGIDVKEKDMICFWWCETSFSTFLFDIYSNGWRRKPFTFILDRSKIRHRWWISTVFSDRSKTVSSSATIHRNEDFIH